MSNQAKDLGQGISEVGGMIKFARRSFRDAQSKSVEPVSAEGVGEHTIPLTQPLPAQTPAPVAVQQAAAVPMPPTVKRAPEVLQVQVAQEPSEENIEEPYDRITFEISRPLRATLTNLATTLNSRVPRGKRTRKINRDTLMRACLSVVEELPWHTDPSLATEEDIAKFVRRHLKAQ